MRGARARGCVKGDMRLRRISLILILIIIVIINFIIIIIIISIIIIIRVSKKTVRFFGF